MDEEKQYTDTEVIVFEDEDGLDIEMELVDEFEDGGQRYVALRPSLESADFDTDEDCISFFAVRTDDEGGELFDLVEDEAAITRLADRLEDRLLSKE